jgi:hypothetical protein
MGKRKKGSVGVDPALLLFIIRKGQLTGMPELLRRGRYLTYV